ncbi:hypothetical protein DDE82_001728 [Stemphylium lycopersici]|nr:hypothetical protein DDE82_001728 [Stemphylium lycopersici]
MVGLLDLPSELLFEIISLVLSSPLEFRQNEKRHRPNWKFSKRNVWFIPSLELLKTQTILNLLLLNRRLYTETREYLAKESQIFDFDVDIAIIDDHWLWPTSRFVLPRKPRGMIHRLNVNVLPCCTEEERHLQTGWDTGGTREMLGHSSQPFTRDHVIWELVAPLIEFLLDRRVYHTLPSRLLDPLSNEDYDTKCDRVEVPITRIDTIAISIDASKYKTGNELLSKEDIPFRTMSGLTHLDFERLYPFDLSQSKYYLLEMIRYITDWASKHGASKIAKKVGKIQFYLNGDMLSELDFDQHARPDLS